MNRFRIALMVVIGLLAAPGLAQAEGFGWSNNRHSSGSSRGSSGGHHAESAGRHNAYPATAPAYGYSGGYGHHGYYGGGYYAAPAYYGWGIHPWGYYGWGYYPYAGAPAVVATQGTAPEPPSITAGVFLGAMLSRDDQHERRGGLDLKLNVDGKRLGFDLDALTLPTTNPLDFTDTALMPMIKGDVTYSLVSDLHTRVRIEAGVQGIGAPGVTYVGPDLGVSGQIALLGPLEVEGSAHWMPVPAYVWDLQAGVGLNFGALAVRGGWRWVRLDDSNRCSDVGVSCGVSVYNGPTVSVGVVF